MLVFIVALTLLIHSRVGGFEALLGSTIVTSSYKQHDSQEAEDDGIDFTARAADKTSRTF